MAFSHGVSLHLQVGRWVDGKVRDSIDKILGKSINFTSIDFE